MNKKTLMLYLDPSGRRTFKVYNMELSYLDFHSLIAFPGVQGMLLIRLIYGSLNNTYMLQYTI